MRWPSYFPLNFSKEDWLFFLRWLSIAAILVACVWGLLFILPLRGAP